MWRQDCSCGLTAGRQAEPLPEQSGGNGAERRNSGKPVGS